MSVVDGGFSLALLLAYHRLIDSDLTVQLGLSSVVSWGLNLTSDSSSCLFEQQPYMHI